MNIERFIEHAIKSGLHPKDAQRVRTTLLTVSKLDRVYHALNSNPDLYAKAHEEYLNRNSSVSEDHMRWLEMNEAISTIFRLREIIKDW